MEGASPCTQEWQAEKLEEYCSSKLHPPRIVGVSAPCRDPNPEQQRWEEEPVLHLVVKINGDSVLLGDPDATFPRTTLLLSQHQYGECTVWSLTAGKGIRLCSPEEGSAGCTQW